jgi:alkylation response protein AidB-like acyl-CoA dehydrogenase
MLDQWLRDNWDEDITVREWWRRLADAGLAFPSWPEGMGGRGVTDAETKKIRAALAAAGVLPAPGGIGPELAAPTLLHHGTEEQQRRFLPAIADGTEAWCQLFSEPGAGSDLAGLSARAIPTDGGWLVTGQKVWNSGASTADFGLLLTRTDPDAPKHRGISYFAIDMVQAGVETRPLRQMNDRAEFDEVFLTDAYAGGDRLVGDLGDGWNVARTTLTYERRAIGTRHGSSVHGGARNGNLDLRVGDVLRAPRPAAAGYMLSSKRMIDLARQHGVAGDPLVRQRLAAYRAQTAARPTGLPSAGKLAISNIARASRDLSLSILGAEGMLAGTEVDVALSSFAAGIGGGTDQIQRNVLAERVLGLPKES